MGKEQQKKEVREKLIRFDILNFQAYDWDVGLRIVRKSSKKNTCRI